MNAIEVITNRALKLLGSRRNDAYEAALALLVKTRKNGGRANWGVMPAIVMLVCVPIMFLVTLMGFEMVRSMNGYHKPNSLTQAIVANSPWGDEMPKNTP